MPLSTVATISFAALLLAFFLNLASDRIPVAKNVAMGIVACVVLFLGVSVALGTLETISHGVSRDITRAGSVSVMRRVDSPFMFFALVAVKSIACVVLFFSAIWVARQAFRRYGSAA
jgi:hypothetical protein